MWQWDYITGMNPPVEGQTRSLLEYLISIGATSESLLTKVSAELEIRGSPYIAHVCQIPNTIYLDESKFLIDAWQGDSVELNFQNVFLYTKPDGTMACFSTPQDTNLEFITQATQLISYIDLKRIRAKLHPIYESCITSAGLNNRVIGNSGTWRHMPKIEVTQKVPLTAKEFENDIAIRARLLVKSALIKFLTAYSLVQLENLQESPYLYSSFTMTTPGRISGGGIPKPLISSLTRSAPRNFGYPAKKSDIKIQLKSNIAKDDRFVHQILSMSKLAQSGDPELAIVGCVSALEWHLNNKFIKFLKRIKSGKIISSSLTLMMKDELFSDLDPHLKEWAFGFAKLRNDIVHGAPPIEKKDHKLAMANEAFSGLKLALQIYKFTNLKYALHKNDKG